jgi:hypothetical protein
MRFKVIPRFVVLALIACAATLALSLSVGVGSVAASSANNGQLHATKDCTLNNPFMAGSVCVITDANLAQIPDNSRLFYMTDQSATLLPFPGVGFIDSNVVLDAGGGNRAVGRCTFDVLSGHGLCTFWDGTGELTGFTARLDVSCPTPVCSLDGTYRFSPLPKK